MTHNNDKLPVEQGFQREERYIVIKRKNLTPVQEQALRAHMARLDIDTIESVVVEHDWPEYETVWRLIEDRVTGRIEAQQQPATSEGLVEALRMIAGLAPQFYPCAPRMASEALASLQPKPDAGADA